LTAKAHVNGLLDPVYDIAMKGSLDLALIDSLFPEVGRKLAGTFAGEFATAGRVSDAQKKRYDKLTGSGSASLSNFTFASTASPVPVSIPVAKMSLSPSAITLTEFRSQLGRSDLALEGAIYDIVPYLLGKGALRGTLTARSKQLDLNEFLGSSTTATPASKDTAKVELQAPMLPKDVDIVFTATADEVKYTQLSMREFAGIITLKDQVLRLVDCRFAAAGGKFSATASYDTHRPMQPHSSLAMKIESLDIAQAVAQLPIIPQLAPLARFTQGLLNTDFNLSTDLKPNLMPDLGTLTMAGSFEALKAAIKGFPVTQALARSGKMNFLDNLTVDRAAFKAGFTNGRLQVQPFSFPVAGQKVTVSGSNGLDQSLDYRVGVEVPSAQLAAITGAAQGVLGKLGIGQLPATITLNFGVGGTATKPIISPLAPSLGSGGAPESGPATSVTGAVKQQLADTLGKARAAAEEKLKAEKERLQQEAQQKATEEVERLKQDAEKAKADAERRAKEEIERKKKEAEEKLRKLNPFKKN
jgi:AsmA-like C-terminal region